MRFTIRKEISSGAVLESRVERSLRGYFFLSFCNGESVTWPEIVNWRITPAIKHFYALTSVRKTTEPVVWGWPRLIPSFGRREINGSLPLPVGTTRVSVKSGRLHRINHLPHRYRDNNDRIFFIARAWVERFTRFVKLWIAEMKRNLEIAVSILPNDDIIFSRISWTRRTFCNGEIVGKFYDIIYIGEMGTNCFDPLFQQWR